LLLLIFAIILFYNFKSKRRRRRKRKRRGGSDFWICTDCNVRAYEYQRQWSTDDNLLVLFGQIVHFEC
jgi:hypothetical protein